MGTVGKLPQNFQPKEYEKRILEFWYSNDIYGKIRRSLKGKPKFYFLDGPPYPSSELIHIGTAWNKVLKDVYLRFYRMLGYDVFDRPGYDCHGLPIEVMTEKRLGFKSKRDIEKFGIEKFIEECRRLVLRNVKSMTEQFKDIGASFDWDNPYMTLTNEYIESAWWFIKRAYEQGLLTKDLRVLHWCPRCETVLSDYEVSEYRELEDPSIYVKFPVKGKEKEYIVIWTTTPWTLPGNIAVMIHPDETYVKVRDLKTGEVYIVAKARLEPFAKDVGLEKYEVVEEFRGADLVGTEYVHPLEDEVPIHKSIRHIVVACPEFVTMEEGTGLVHSAPGHGPEDFECCKRHGLPVICPVGPDGRFTEQAGKYAGLKVREEGNKVIIEDLKKKGLLLAYKTIVHRYPVCWRCKTPLIFRATEQWIIRITKLKDKIIEEAEKVNWVPKWAGTARFRDWLERLRDWVVSRQRYWGIPLPIWVCSKCGHVEVIGSKKELEEKAIGSVDIKDLHRPWIDKVVLKCPKCGGEMRRVPDVCDVWLDSGIAFFAVLQYPMKKELYESMKPVDLVIEGHDQTAGWFYSLLRCGVVAFGERPYRSVLMHGFALDEQGREMHKSLGNFVTPKEVIEKYCRDALRLFELCNTTWEDLRFSWRGVEDAFRDLHIMWNVYYFASTYMNLDKFDPVKHKLEDYEKYLQPEDRWILSRVNTVAREVTKAVKELRPHDAARVLRKFIVEDVSRWYIMLIRRRVWIEEDHPLKLSAYTVLYYVLERFLRLAAPFIPFITEEIYQRMFRPISSDMPESVHMLRLPEPEEKWIDEELEKHMEVVRKLFEAAAALRSEAGVKRRWPLKTLAIAPANDDVRKAVENLKHILSSQVNVKEVKLLSPEEEKNLVKYMLEPKWSVLGPALKKAAKKVVEELQKRVEEVKEALEREGKYVVEVDGDKYEITPEMVEVKAVAAEGWLVKETKFGRVYLYTKVSEEEIVEGLARDVVRRIQFMRKELDLPLDAYIEVKVYGPEHEIEKIKRKLDYIATETRAKKITFVKSPDEVDGDLVRDWDIEGSKYRIGVKRS